MVGLAVQTASFGQSIGSDVAELVGWVTLVVAGLCGMARLERIPLVQALSYRIDTFADEIKGYRRSAQKGVEAIKNVRERGEGSIYGIDEIIETREEQIQKMKEDSSKAEAWGNKLYKFQKWFFLVGLGALMISRAWAPVAQMISG